MAYLWGRWTLEVSGRVAALKSAEGTNEHTRFTQVQGPREEVKPLLLPVSLSISWLEWCVQSVSLSSSKEEELAYRKINLNES